MARNEKPPRIDRRKIPPLFRAIEKDGSTTYYGRLISEDGFMFSCWAVHHGEGSYFKERVLKKSDFRFSPLLIEDFRLQAKRGLSKMHGDSFEKKLEFEALEAQYNWAVEKVEEIVGEFA